MAYDETFNTKKMYLIYPKPEKEWNKKIQTKIFNHAHHQTKPTAPPGGDQ